MNTQTYNTPVIEAIQRVIETHCNVGGAFRDSKPLSVGNVRESPNYVTEELGWYRYDRLRDSKDYDRFFHHRLLS
jgi:hypothetical protein